MTVRHTCKLCLLVFGAAAVWLVIAEWVAALYVRYPWFAVGFVIWTVLMAVACWRLVRGAEGWR